MDPVRSTLIGVVLAAALIGGCGDDSDDSAAASTESDAPAMTLEKCGPNTGAGGWSGSVSGISCDAAGKLILDDFIHDFGDEVLGDFRYTQTAMERGKPGEFDSAGYRCRHAAYSDEDGWALQCERGETVIAFHLTP